MLFHNQDQTPALTLLFEDAPLNTPEWIRANGVKFINYGRILKRSLFSQETPPVPIRGPAVVQANLIEGLRRLGFETSPFGMPFNFTPSSHVGVLSGAFDALPWAIQAKEKGHIEKLVAGPNLVLVPEDHGRIITNQLIDIVLTPSLFVSEIYRFLAPELSDRLLEWAVGVDEVYWNPGTSSNAFDFLIFNKTSNIEEQFYQIDDIVNVLDRMNLTYYILDYGQFTQNEYKEALQTSQAMIYIGAAESQGICLFEAWSCNVPTLVRECNVHQYQDFQFHVSSAPYLTDMCGMFYEDKDFKSSLDIFLQRILTFKPREYVLRNFTLERAAERYLRIFD